VDVIELGVAVFVFLVPIATALLVNRIYSLAAFTVRASLFSLLVYVLYWAYTNNPGGIW